MCKNNLKMTTKYGDSNKKQLNTLSKEKNINY
jgi:hypothetical protein